VLATPVIAVVGVIEWVDAVAGLLDGEVVLTDAVVVGPVVGVQPATNTTRQSAERRARIISASLSHVRTFGRDEMPAFIDELTAD
jgi:hypothetical protein